MQKTWLPALLMLTAFIAAFLSVAAIQSGSIAGFVLLSISALAHIVAYVMLLLGNPKYSVAYKSGAFIGLMYVLPAFFLNIKTFYYNENVSIISLVLLGLSIGIFSLGILNKN